VYILRLLGIIFLLSSLSAQRFAGIGDLSLGTEKVAELVNSWEPDFIICTGDVDNYTSDNSRLEEFAGLFDAKIYSAIGNHDDPEIWGNYFGARYKIITKGNIDFYFMDSNNPSYSWLLNNLYNSTKQIRIVVIHHPVYSSNFHGSTPELNWGWSIMPIHLILSGHDHSYERIEHLGQTFIINGLGGAPRYCAWGPLVSGSWSRYCSRHGATLYEVVGNTVVGKFYNIDGNIIDEFVVQGGEPLWLGVIPEYIPPENIPEEEDDWCIFCGCSE